MTASTETKGSRRWLVAAVIVVVVVPLLAFGFQTGECVDFVAEAAAESFCGTGPAVGVAGAWALTAAAVIFAAFATRRGLSLRQQR